MKFQKATEKTYVEKEEEEEDKEEGEELARIWNIDVASLEQHG